MLRTIDRQAAEQLHPKAFEARLRPETSSVPHSYIVDPKTRFFVTEDGTLVADVPLGDCEPLRYVFRHWTTQCRPCWVAGHDASVQHLLDEIRRETKPKKVRCTCKRCGKVNYLKAADIDRTEPYLCAKCDGLFIAWQNEGLGSCNDSGRDLAAFLALKRR